MTEALFVYGTLLDPGVQRALFDREVPRDPAILNGWAAYQSEPDGFLFIRPSESESVSGVVILLSPEELRIADAWEDVPLYQRERVTVTPQSFPREVWTYTRRDGTGTKHDGRATSSHRLEQVIEWARAVRVNAKNVRRALP